MQVSLLHEGKPALLRVEGRSGAPAVLFFHPFPLHAGVWEETLLACASAGLCAAALDAPGFGGSPPRGEPLTMDALADLGASALDAIGAPRAAIAGCSMGGYAAMAFMRRRPDRVRSLALMATKASPDAPEAKQNRERQAKLALEKGAAAVVAEFAPKLLAPGAPDRLRRRVEELAQLANAQGIADALRGMAQRPDSRPELSGWSVPTLVIAGEQDQLMSLSEMETIARAVPGARLEVIRGAGHLPFLENPAAVGPLLTAHLRKT